MRHPFGRPARTVGATRRHQPGPLAAALMAAVAVLSLGGGLAAGAESTLDAVRARDFLRCGASNNPMSAEWTKEGAWRGFDVDLCRAIAAAVLGDADKIDLLLLSSQLRLPALVTGEVDVLFGSLTWTYARDAGQPVDFATIVFFDGQGFLGLASELPERLSDLRDAIVCVSRGTTSLVNLEAEIRRRLPTWQVLILESDEGAEQAFLNRRCHLYTSDVGYLASLRATSGVPGLKVFAETISKEPLGAAVRAGDPQWLKIVRWVIAVTVAAEEAGLSATDVDAGGHAVLDPVLQPLLAAVPGVGAPLGLADTWALEIIRQVGNYGEIFDRNLGAGSALKMERGLNRLWTQGGLLFALPLH